MAKRLISAKIPEEMYIQIQESEYKTNTECIIAALNLLFSNTHQEKENTSNRNTELIQVLSEQIMIKDQQFHDLLMAHQGLLMKVKSEPVMMVEAPGTNKRWWEFWR